MKYDFQHQANCNCCKTPVTEHKYLGRRLNTSQGLFRHSKMGVTVSVLRCRNCGLVYANPMPVPINFNDHYGVQPEDYWNEHYFADEPNYYRPQIERFTTLAKKQPHGLTALDIGAGIGKGMKALARAGFTTFGLEPSAPFRQAAVERGGINPDALQLASIEDAEYPESSFDFISFLAVLEHLYDPAHTLEKVVRWLKPDGLLLVEVPSSDYLIYRVGRWAYRLLGCDLVPDLSPMHPPYHLYQFTSNCFEKHGKRVGYRIAASEYYPCPTHLPRPFSLLNRPLQWVMRQTATGMQLEVWLAKVPGTHESSTSEAVQ